MKPNIRAAIKLLGLEEEELWQLHYVLARSVIDRSNYNDAASLKKDQKLKKQMQTRLAQIIFEN